MPNSHKRVEIVCEGCGGPGKARADNVRKGFGRFCSRRCGARAARAKRVTNTEILGN